MIILTAISIIIFLYFINFFGCFLNPDLYSKYDRLLNRAPFFSYPQSVKKQIYGSSNLFDVLFGKISVKSGEFWVYLNRWMMLVMILAIAALIVNRILIIKKRIPEYKADIFIYAGVLEGVVIYILTPVLFAKYSLKYFFVSKPGIVCLLFISYCITMLLVCHFSYKKSTAYNNLVHPDSEKKEDELLEDEKRIKTLKKVGIVGIILFEITLIYWFRPFKICMDYRKNYGSYEKEDHARRTDLEDAYLGNYQNKAVSTEKGLFFIASSEKGKGKEGDYKIVKKMDSDGNVTEVYRSEGNHYSIGYHEGYIYLANEYEIIKVDVDTGESEQIIVPENKQQIQDFCIIDDRLYVQSTTSYVEMKKLHYDPDKIENKIVYFEIKGDALSDPVLYLSDVIDRYDSHFDGEILSYYLVYGSDYHGYYNLRRQSFGQYKYIMDKKPLSPQGSENHLSISERDIPSADIPDVGSFNVHNGAIYYIHLLEDGFEICKCGMDGTGSEVIDTCTDGIDYRDIDIEAFRMAISDNKILVYSTPAYATDDETNDMEWIDSVEYVVDLK